MSQSKNQAKALFDQLIEMSSPEERESFLNEKCSHDPELRKKVEGLLGSFHAAGSFLEQPAVEAVATELVFEDYESQHIASGDTLPEMETQTLEFLAPSENSDALGRLGQYEIMEVIGRGGMGIVLRGVDPKLNRVVAIKVLSPVFAANPTAHKRFLREAQAAAAVSHDHIVTIHSVEETPIPHLVMEYIDGKSLQQRIDEEGQLEVKEVLRIARQVAAGLAAAHEQGLTHRDIKPSNILLQNGIQRVQITDFGLARAAADADITRTGEIAGTPQYMSPEQARSEPVEPRSDLFSLGSVMYAMCCGHSPFRADTPYASIKRVCEDKPRSIRENNPEIPTWLEDIVFRLLEKNPDDRFQSAEEVAELLGKHLSHLQDPGATAFPGRLPAVKKTPAPRHSTTRRRAAAAVAVLLMALLTLGFTEAAGVTNFAGTVIRMATGEGTLVIEVDDPTVQVSLDGEELSITGAGLQELKLRPGQYQFRATKNGEPVEQRLVSISRGDREVVRVSHQASEHRSSDSHDQTGPKLSQTIEDLLEEARSLLRTDEQHEAIDERLEAIEKCYEALSLTDENTDPALTLQIRQQIASHTYDASLVLSHGSRRDPELALRISSKSLMSCPSSVKAVAGMAHPSYRLGKYREADNYLKQARGLGRFHAPEFVLNALIQWELGRHDWARSVAEDNKKLKGKWFWFTVLLAELEEKLGPEYTEASAESYRILGNKSEGNPAVHWYRQSCDLLQAQLDKEPENESLRLNLVKSQVALADALQGDAQREESLRIANLALKRLTNDEETAQEQLKLREQLEALIRQREKNNDLDESSTVETVDD